MQYIGIDYSDKSDFDNVWYYHYLMILDLNV
jgi:hypothetical protein